MHHRHILRGDGHLHLAGLFDNLIDAEDRRLLSGCQLPVLQKNAQRLGSFIEQEHQAFLAFLEYQQIWILDLFGNRQLIGALTAKKQIFVFTDDARGFADVIV